MNNFFEFISKFCEKLDMNIVFSSKEGIVTMAIFFKAKDDGTHIPELIISGPPETLESNFYDALSNPLNKAVELIDNIEFFDKQIARIKKEKESKATNKKTSVKKTPIKKETVTGKKPEFEIPAGDTGPMFDTVSDRIKENAKTIEKIESGKRVEEMSKRTDISTKQKLDYELKQRRAIEAGTKVHEELEKELNKPVEKDKQEQIEFEDDF